MRTEVNEQLRREAEEYSLQFSCEHCVYFDESTASCSEGYPNHEHRLLELSTRTSLVFCKRFELF